MLDEHAADETRGSWVPPSEVEMQIRLDFLLITFCGELLRILLPLSHEATALREISCHSLGVVPTVTSYSNVKSRELFRSLPALMKILCTSNGK